MEEILSIINVIGVLGATIISAITLFSTKKLQKNQQQTDVMTAKRSERIDDMRTYSANLISCAKQFLYDLANDKTKRDLICACAKFTALLQYAYEHDVEIIDSANKIVDICLTDNLNKDKLKDAIYSFWTKADVYVGVEHERLKNEALGNIKNCGDIDTESSSFENLHNKLSTEQSKYVSKKK